MSRLKSGLPFKTLLSSTEAVLKKAGRPYVKHDIGHTVELDVEGGPRFTVRIQRLEPLMHANPMLGGLDLRGPRNEVNFAIILSREAGAKESAATFVGELLAALPKDPWKGLGFVQRLTARSLWKRWAAGLEER